MGVVERNRNIIEDVIHYVWNEGVSSWMRAAACPFPSLQPLWVAKASPSTLFHLRKSPVELWMCEKGLRRSRDPFVPVLI